MNYPEQILKLCKEPGFYADGVALDGRAAKFDCGTVIGFRLERDSSGKICRASYSTNGCGYMMAAAEILCRKISTDGVKNLCGDVSEWASDAIKKEIEEITAERIECVNTVVEAISDSFFSERDDFLARDDNNQGLVCTCFSITEGDILNFLESNPKADLDGLMKATAAGMGCGACRLLLLEIYEAQRVAGGNQIHF